MFEGILLMTGGEKESGPEMFLMMGLVVVVFYFFMIRPQQKKQKEQKLFRESLAKGDKIVTIGGIHGKILEVKEADTTLIISVEGGNKLKIEKSAISADKVVELGEDKK